MELSRVLAVLSSHTGRDKVAKVLHYACRVPSQRSLFEPLRVAVGSSRRVGRFFSFLNSVPGLLAFRGRVASARGWRARAEALMSLCADLADVLYYVSDNLTFAADYGFVRLSPRAKAVWENHVGSWTWMVSVLVGLYYTAGDLCRAGKGGGDGEPVDRTDLALRTVAELADAQLALFFCFPNTTWSSRSVGYFGVINAVAGFWRLYRRAK